MKCERLGRQRALALQSLTSLACFPFVTGSRLFPTNHDTSTNTFAISRPLSFRFL